MLSNIESQEENKVSEELSNLFSREERIAIVLWLYTNYNKAMLTKKTDSALLSLIGDDANILSFVIEQWKKKICKVPKIIQEQVAHFLEEVQLQLHYLYSKPTSDWDEYDISNYYSILNKRGKIRRVYAYTADVKDQDKYQVTILPSLFFDTKQEAEQELIDCCKQQKQDPMDYVIHWLWSVN